MAFELVLLPKAKQEWESKIDLYNAKRENLGYEVFLEIENYLKKIQENPLHYQKRYGEVRGIFTKRFHFGIYYVFEEEIITVLAILNTKEDISKLQR